MADPEIQRLMYSDESCSETEDRVEEDLLDIMEDDELSVIESDPELTSRQLSYPPVPVYASPTATAVQDGNVKDKLGLLTPMEELTESESIRSFSSRNSRRVRRVSFSPDVEEDPGILDGTGSPGEDPALLMARHERVRTWQEKHHYSPDQFTDVLSTSEMDSSTLLKSMESLPPAFLPSMVETMTNSLTTLRSQLSTLNAVALFGDRLRDLQPLSPHHDHIVLYPLLRKLCTMVGESRTPESSLTLSRLIRGAGPALVTQDLLTIISSSCNKRKPAAIDGLTYALLIFPRDDFEIEKIAEAVCLCLWNPKRRVRQAALECLAVVAHVLGPGIALPFLRELIEEHRPAVSNNGNPSSAVSARVSRRLLPSPSPGGLVDYALVLPTRQNLSRLAVEETGLDPILSKSEFGADVAWIIHGTAPGTANVNNGWSSSDTGTPRASSKGSSRGSRHSGTRSGAALHQKHRDGLKASQLPPVEPETMSVFKMQELGQEVIPMPLTSESPEGLDEDFSLEEDKKVRGRDRDSGVSSLKSLRVMSPIEVERTEVEAEAESLSLSTASTQSSTPQEELLAAEPEPPPEPESPRCLSPGELEPADFVIRRPVLPRSSFSKGKSSTQPSTPSTGSSGSSAADKLSVRSMPAPAPPKLCPVRTKLRNYTHDKKGSGSGEVFPMELPPLNSPAQALNQGLTKLGSTDWETNIEGFRLLVRLVRHHPDTIRGDLHHVNMAALRQISNLRSQVSRAACLFFKEMFCAMGRLMEPDVDRIAEKLLDKSADTNKFIRESSLAALEAMAENLHPAKTIIPMENFGSKHRNGVVRATTARMTTVIIKQLGPERCLTLLADKVLPMLIRSLQEGSLETRTHAKTALSMLVGHGNFEYALRQQIPSDTLRHVEKSLESVKSQLLQKQPRDRRW